MYWGWNNENFGKSLIVMFVIECVCLVLALIQFHTV